MVAVSVVDLFEVIEIAECESETDRSPSRRSGQLVVDGSEQPAAVRQSGQTVVKRLVGQRPLPLNPPRRADEDLRGCFEQGRVPLVPVASSVGRVPEDAEESRCLCLDDRLIDDGAKLPSGARAQLDAESGAVVDREHRSVEALDRQIEPKCRPGARVRRPAPRRDLGAIGRDRTEHDLVGLQQIADPTGDPFDHTVETVDRRTGALRPDPQDQPFQRAPPLRKVDTSGDVADRDDQPLLGIVGRVVIADLTGGPRSVLAQDPEFDPVMIARVGAGLEEHSERVLEVIGVDELETRATEEIIGCPSGDPIRRCTDVANHTLGIEDKTHVWRTPVCERAQLVGGFGHGCRHGRCIDASAPRPEKWEELPATLDSPPMPNDKPTVIIADETPPTELVIDDLVVGDGNEAMSGAVVTVHYVGVAWSSGEQFDASWDRSDPFDFRLGTGQVIAGWDQGVAGMRVGGRRRLTIPPELGYGSRGAGGAIKGGETLVFVVDLLNIG